MSYARMDHAGWVEQNNAARNSMNQRRKGYKPTPEKLSDFQARLMDVLGIVGGGIYNAPIKWETVDWKYGGGVSLLWSGEMATFDFSRLTYLVFLCHEARIRCSIEPAMRYLRLSFWPRVAEGGMGRRHPNLDEAVAAFRKYFPADHSLIWRPADKPDAPARAAE